MQVTDRSGFPSCWGHTLTTALPVELVRVKRRVPVVPTGAA